MALHLQPAPEAEILHFPNTPAEDRAALAGQIANIQAGLVARHGDAGLLLFAEAAIAAVARAARAHGATIATRYALELVFDQEAGLTETDHFPGAA